MADALLGAGEVGSASSLNVVQEDLAFLLDLPDVAPILGVAWLDVATGQVPIRQLDDPMLILEPPTRTELAILLTVMWQMFDRGAGGGGFPTPNEHGYFGTRGNRLQAGMRVSDLEQQLQNAGWSRYPARGRGWRYHSPGGEWEIRVMEKGREGLPYFRIQNRRTGNYVTVEG